MNLSINKLDQVFQHVRWVDWVKLTDWSIEKPSDLPMDGYMDFFKLALTLVQQMPMQSLGTEVFARISINKQWISFAGTKLCKRAVA